MRTTRVNYLFWLVGFILIIFAACEKDDLDPIDPENVDPDIEEFDLIGVRIVIDDIKCVKKFDIQGTHEELYGYLEVWAEYESTYEFTEERYETENKALVWFAERDDDNYVALEEGESKSIDRSVDFIFNRNSFNNARIVVGGHLKEYDYEGSDEDFGYEEKDYDLEVASNDKLTFKFQHTSGESESEFNYKFEVFNPRGSAILPEGYQLTDVFNILNTDENPNQAGAYPALPVPFSYEARPPGISERLIVGQKKWSDFYPDILTFMTNESTQPNYVYGLKNKISLLDHNALPLDDIVISGEYEEDEWQGILTKEEEDFVTERHITLPALDKAPRLQLIRFFKPLDSWRIPAGGELSSTVEYKIGYEKETYSEFQATVGYSIGGFSAELTATFGQNVKRSEEETDSKTVTYSAPDNNNVLYVEWQMWEEYRFVDENGDIFKDPRFEFGSTSVLTIPTDHLVPKAYLFDAY